MKKIAPYILILTSVLLLACRNNNKNISASEVEDISEMNAEVLNTEVTLELYGSEFIDIPELNIKILNTEVTQELYESIMGENPSYRLGKKLPVESTSLYDAIYFCNKMSKKYGLEPVYSVDETTDVSKWDYTPHVGESIIEKKINQNLNANGFRLPLFKEYDYLTVDEIQGGRSGFDEFAWYKDNSDDMPHPVALKKPNRYGLYDMVGNVSELTGELDYIEGFGYWCIRLGGSFDSGCFLLVEDFDGVRIDKKVGFRIVCSITAF